LLYKLSVVLRDSCIPVEALVVGSGVGHLGDADGSAFFRRCQPEPVAGIADAVVSKRCVWWKDAVIEKEHGV
jgi:hypothetical protein